MARILKIVQRMLGLPAEMRFGEVNKVLEYFDCCLENVKGSHFVYMKGDIIMTIVKKKNKVKRGYIKEIIEILNLEEWYEKNKK